FLTNSSGIYFGRSASINVGALTATTHNISNADFMAGNLNFTRNGATGKVENEGSLTAELGGYIALLAPEVRNNGIVIAQGGTVALAAGEAFELQFDGARLVNIRVESATIAAFVENGNAVEAPGGLIILSAQAANSLQGGVVKNSGTLEANTLSDRNGVIRLESSDLTESSGIISASGRNTGEHGGNVSLLGNKVGLLGTASIDASGDAGGGTVLVGGNWQGQGPERNAEYSYVSPTSSIDASGLGNGDGGKVVIWADEATRYYGNIKANGGVLGGNGGQVEVSGKGFLDFNGTVSTLAPLGLNGLLLLDPKNIEIAIVSPDGAVSRTAASDFNPYTVNPAETSWITPTQLVTLLDTSSVNMFAANDITVTNAVDASANTGVFSLGLIAGRNVNINADLTLRGAFSATANQSWPDTTNREANGDSYGFLMANTATIRTDSGSTATASGRNINISVQSHGANTSAKATIGTLIAGGNGVISIQADAPTFNGGADSIQVQGTTGRVVLHPTTNTKNYVIGTGGTPGTDYILDPTLFSSVIKDGFSYIELGLNGNTFSQQLSINSPLVIKDSLRLYMRGTGAGVTLNEALSSSSTDTKLEVWAGSSGHVGTFTQTTNGSISGLSTVTVNADSMVLNGGAGSIQGSNTLTLTQTNFNRTAELGRPDGALETDLFALSASELATIGSGFSQVVLAAGGAGVTVYGDRNFADTTMIGRYASTDSLVLDSTARITMAANKNLTLRGSGLLQQMNGATITASGTGNIIIYANEIDLQGAANSINGAGTLTLTPASAARAIQMGGTDDTTKFSLTSSELATLGSGFSGMTFGSSSLTGGLTIAGPITLNNSTTFSQATTGSFTVNATPTVTGSITFTNTTAALALNASVSATAGFTRTTGTTIVGADNLTVSAGTGMATFGNTVTHGAYNFTVTADDLALSANWIGTGARILQPTTTNRTIGLAGGAGSFALSAAELGYLRNDSPTSVTIGRADGTGTITGHATTAITFDDPLTLRGGDMILTNASNDFSGTLSIVSNGAGNVNIRDTNALALGTANLGTGTFTLTAAGAITQTGAITQSAGAGAVSITAGANDITLNNTGNNFTGSVSVVTGRNISLLDSDTLSLAAITSTGTIDIATTSGNLTVAGNITTTDSSATALTLNAGKSAAAGTAAGGDIIISGTPTLTVGAGGTARLFSGSSAGSTGLADLITAASGETRDNADETSTLSPALAAGTHAIYRNATGSGSSSSDGGGSTTTTTTTQDPPPPVVVLSPPLPSPTTAPPPLATTTPPPSGGQPGSSVTSGSDGSSQAAAGGPSSGGISVSLVKEPSLQQTGIITVSVPKEMATAGSGFSFPLPAQVSEAAGNNTPIRVTTTAGDPLPGWLSFNAETNAFVASAVPDGAFPMQVVVTIGGTRTTIVISERSE
ncbi:MAG: hypothetical protein U1C96_01960, partial [Gallionella sp.]|nr:hypothetical protein [Gallionella sp.]